MFHSFFLLKAQPPWKQNTNQRGITSIPFSWKQTNRSLVIQMWSTRRKCAASARAWLQDLQHTKHTQQHITTQRNTHCNTLQHWATHYYTLQLTTTLCNTHWHCNTQQHTATHCNTLQHTATHCNIGAGHSKYYTTVVETAAAEEGLTGLLNPARRYHPRRSFYELGYRCIYEAEVCCNVVQHGEVWCSGAVWCSVVQCGALVLLV